MELTIAMALSILASVISVSSFVLNRKDKAISDQKENHQELIQYQLKELQDNVKEILAKLNKYDDEIDERIKETMDLHIRLYHGGEKKWVLGKTLKR